MLDKNLIETILEQMALEDVLNLKHIIMGVMLFKTLKLFKQHIRQKKSEIRECHGVMVHYNKHLIRTTREGSLLSLNRWRTHARTASLVRYLHLDTSRGDTAEGLEHFEGQEMFRINDGRRLQDH